jgi:transcriptional regulator with XRE-family HTH domain
MSRPEKDIDPDGGPLAELALALRALRQEVGLTYRELAAIANYSHGVLSAAAGGSRLPSWAVVQAFVTACGVDDAEWRVRWERAKATPVKATVEPPADVTPPAVSARSVVDPRGARTPAEFVEHMRELRVWANQPSLRALAARARRAGHVLPVSTLHDSLTRDRLPSHDVVIAFVVACGAPDPQVWITAWRGLCDPARLSEEEPYLTVVHGAAPWFLRARLLRRLLPMSALALAGVVSLIGSATVALPFSQIETVQGNAGASASLFADERVKQLLLAHNIKVKVTSGQSTMVGDDPQDFVFASGEVMAAFIADRLREQRRYSALYRPWVAPLAIAGRAAYARALVAAGVAKQQESALYYDLDMARLLELMRAGKTWDALGVKGDNSRVVVRSTDPCQSSFAASYVGLLAAVDLGHVPVTTAEVDAAAERIKPAYRAQGMPIDTWESISVNRSLVVIRETQYFDNQFDRRDDDIVLLYPTPTVQGAATMVASSASGIRLAELVTNDPAIRARLAELGYRPLDQGGDPANDPFYGALRDHDLPVPQSFHGEIAPLPESRLLQRLISEVGDC